MRRLNTPCGTWGTVTLAECALFGHPGSVMKTDWPIVFRVAPVAQGGLLLYQQLVFCPCEMKNETACYSSVPTWLGFRGPWSLTPMNMALPCRECTPHVVSFCGITAGRDCCCVRVYCSSRLGTCKMHVACRRMYNLRIAPHVLRVSLDNPM